MDTGGKGRADPRGGDRREGGGGSACGQDRSLGRSHTAGVSDTCPSGCPREAKGHSLGRGEKTNKPQTPNQKQKQTMCCFKAERGGTGFWKNPSDKYKDQSRCLRM